MRDRCEASGLPAPFVNATTGRGTCPLCEDDWHVVTKDGRLTTHRRVRHREWSPADVATRLAQAALRPR
jgi:hypothetical protein